MTESGVPDSGTSTPSRRARRSIQAAALVALLLLLVAVALAPQIRARWSDLWKGGLAWLDHGSEVATPTDGDWVAVEQSLTREVQAGLDPAPGAGDPHLGPREAAGRGQSRAGPQGPTGAGPAAGARGAMAADGAPRAGLGASGTGSAGNLSPGTHAVPHQDDSPAWETAANPGRPDSIGVNLPGGPAESWGDGAVAVLAGPDSGPPPGDFFGVTHASTSETTVTAWPPPGPPRFAVSGLRGGNLLGTTENPGARPENPPPLTSVAEPPYGGWLSALGAAITAICACLCARCRECERR